MKLDTAICLSIFCLVAVSLAEAEVTKITCSKEGTKYPYPGDCSKYAECNKQGYLEVKGCGLTGRFDYKKKICSGLFSEECSAVKCLEGDTSPVPGNCKAYSYCEGGVWKKSSCYFWHRYDPVEKRCRGGYDCKASPECAPDGITKPTPGLDCKTFLQCKNSKWVETECGMLSGHYDIKKNACDHSVVCDCKSGETKPIPNQCKKYMTCERGQFKQTYCGFYKKFDKTSKSCVWSYHAHC